jgi:hypothetical protein
MMNGLLRFVLRNEAERELEKTFVREWRYEWKGAVFVLLDRDLFDQIEDGGERALHLA